MFICASARVCPANGCSSAHRPHVCAPPTAQDGGMGADLAQLHAARPHGIAPTLSGAKPHCGPRRGSSNEAMTLPSLGRRPA